MKKKLLFMVLVGAVLLSAGPVCADDGFYVIAGGGKAGTQITSVPYTINSPGLYCLAGNLDFSSTSGTAILVNASDVTLDLMGFSLTGPGKTFRDQFRHPNIGGETGRGNKKWFHQELWKPGGLRWQCEQYRDSSPWPPDQGYRYRN